MTFKKYAIVPYEVYKRLTKKEEEGGATEAIPLTTKTVDTGAVIEGVSSNHPSSEYYASDHEQLRSEVTD